MRMTRGLFAAAAAVIAFGAVSVAASPATAAVKLCQVKVGTEITYVACDSVPGGDGTPGGGGSGPAPECELSTSYPTYCKSDGVACLLNDPAKNPQEAVEDDAGPKPEGDEEYHIAYESCSDGSGRDWFWTTGETISTEDLALQAFGKLTFTPFTMTFNPANRTIVNLDTWWWAQGASTETLVGSAAAGVRALAAPDRMEIDPGDGSGVMSCEFVTAKSDACSYRYTKASVRGSARDADGKAAYAARMRLVWAVSFEQNGSPIEVDGLPTTFSSPWEESPVVVREIQTVVRPKS